MMEIVLDSADVYSSFLGRLYSESSTNEGFLILYDCEKEVRFDKFVEIISDPYRVNFNDRRFMSKIFQEMADYANNYKSEQLINVQTLLEKLVIDICDDSEYTMTYDANPELTELLKLFKVRVDYDGEDLSNKLVSYMKMSHRVLGKIFFIFINIRDYLNDELMELFYKGLCYENVYALMIERHEYRRTYLINRVIIDKDLCLIYN